MPKTIDDKIVELEKKITEANEKYRNLARQLLNTYNRIEESYPNDLIKTEIVRYIEQEIIPYMNKNKI